MRGLASIVELEPWTAGRSTFSSFKDDPNAAYRDIRGRARMVYVAMGAWIVAALVAIWADVLEIRVLERLQDFQIGSGGSAALVQLLDDADASDNRVAAASVFYLAALLASAVALCFWMHRANWNLTSLGHPSRFTPGWAVGWWFVPIMNVFRPFQVMKDIAVGSGQSQLGPILGLWWAGWLVGGFIGRGALSATFGDATISEQITADWASIVGDSVFLMPAILMIFIVRKVTGAQESANRAAASASR
jgi:hypothetical protein